MRKIAILLMLFVFASWQMLSAQTKVVTGIVTSADDGATLPGVSVMVKGTTIGMSTDIDGKYEIKVPENAILIFASLGYQDQEVKVGNQTVINVVLKSSNVQLEEVVVTALGIRREKKALGYTVQEVSGEELNKGGNTDVVKALSGKIAGVEVRQSSGMPGAPSQVMIRGARSFSGNNQPLYVVDGMPISTESDYTSNVTGAASSDRASDIDPNDIESINVLKGQAATALYGLRASNGVIVITTKKGKSSEVGKMTVSLSTSLTLDKVSRLPEVQQIYAQGTGGKFAAANSFSWGPKISDLSADATYGGDSQGHVGQFFDPYQNKWLTPVAHNNPKEFFEKTGYTNSNSINISNRVKNGNYSIGLGNQSQTGIVDNTGMDRYTAKLAGDFNMNDKWTVGYSGNYSDNFIKKLPSGNDSWLFTVYGAPASFDLMGTPYHQDGTFGDYRQISYRRGSVGVNPRWATENNHYYEKTKRFFGNTYLEFKPATWATIKYQVGVDTYTTDNENYTEMGKGNLGSSAQYPTPSNPNFSYIEPTGGSIYNYGITRRRINSLLTAVFNKKINDDINASFLIGNEIDDNYSETYSASGLNFTTPGWNNLANTTTQYADYNKYRRRTAGFFGNLSVDYKGMLFFNATGRYDIVSSMPSDNRSFFYPSVSLGFLFTELNLFKDQDVLNYGKIRVSYASVGQAADEYHPVPYYVTGGASSGFLSSDTEIAYPVSTVTGYKLTSSLFDPKLKPQLTSNTEIGLELKFFNNRLGLDYSYYYQNATDQIFPVPLAGSTGYSQIFMNAGQMIGTGHEIMLNGKPVQSTNFDWDMAINFTKSESRVEKLAEGVESIDLGGYTTPNIRASAGDTYPTIYGETYLRDNQGRLIVDADGLPQAGEFGKIGSVTPDFYVGFNNTFTIFKNFTLSAQIDWKQGGQMYSGSNRLMDLYGSSKKTENRDETLIVEGVKEDGTVNDIEVAHQDYYSRLSDIPESAIFETSFVKLREVSLSVNIPKKYIKFMSLQRATLGFSTRNILLWTTLPNFDPETSQGQGNMAGGMDYMSLPQTTSYGFNLSLTF